MQGGRQTRTVEIELPTPYPKQRDAIWTPARFAFIEASSKAGKTVGVMSWILNECLTGPPDLDCTWASPIYKQAVDPFERMCRMLDNAGVPSSIWTPNNSEMFIRFSQNRRIHFRSAEKPDALYGKDNRAFVWDEASRMREEAWHAGVSTLTKTRGRGRAIGNNKGRGNWFHKMCRYAEQGDDPNFHYAKITAYDAVEAGVLSLEEIEMRKRTTPEHIFRQLYMADAGDDGGNPFGYDAIQRNTKPLSKLPAEHFGIDLAKYQDWTVIMGCDRNGDICYFERFRDNWEATGERILAAVGDKPTLADGTGVGDAVVERVRLIRPNIEGFVFSSSSKQQLMGGLAVAMQQDRTSVLEGVHKDELETFEYEPTGSGYRYSAPDGLNDDTVCAHALMVKCRAQQSTASYLIGGSPAYAIGPTDDDEWGWKQWN